MSKKFPHLENPQAALCVLRGEPAMKRVEPQYRGGFKHKGSHAFWDLKFRPSPRPAEVYPSFVRPKALALPLRSLLQPARKEKRPGRRGLVSIVWRCAVRPGSFPLSWLSSVVHSAPVAAAFYCPAPCCGGYRWQRAALNCAANWCVPARRPAV